MICQFCYKERDLYRVCEFLACAGCLTRAYGEDWPTEHVDTALWAEGMEEEEE